MGTAAPVIAPPLPSTETQLEYLVNNTQACMLQPYCFFVSWQGVLTLAYKGFPPALVSLKQQLTDFYPALPKESPGSRWPKTSLASLREGQRLTPDQLQRLNELCRKHSSVFDTATLAEAQAVLVNSLSTLVYETRCCERIISRKQLLLAEPADLAAASPEEVARVQHVVAEADDDNYWYHASRDGNREQHYRSPALGVTLAHELACFRPQQAAAAATASTQQGGGGGGGSSTWSSVLPDIVRGFRAAVQEEFPELYAWFNEQSLHITIRAIIL
eukprot:gene11186-11336_t